MKEPEDTCEIEVSEVSPSRSSGSERRALWFQIWATFVVDLSAINSGFSGGFPGVCLPQLRNDPSIQASEEDSSWIASLPALGGICGCLLSCWVGDYLGRKGTMTLGSISSLLGWGLMAAAPNVATILAGRFLVGIGTLQASVKQLYISEIAEVRIRSLVGSTGTLCWNLGVLMAYSMGILLPWRIVSASASLLPLALMILLMCLPETPGWLVSKNRLEEAEASLLKFRGTKTGASDEIQAIIVSNNKLKQQVKSMRGNLTSQLLSMRTIRRFTLLTVLFFVHQFTGTAAILSYALDLFQQLGSQVDHNTAALVVAGIQVVINVASTLLLHRFSKKSLLVCSGVFLTISLAILSAYTYMDGPEQSLGWRWVPAAAVWLTIIFGIPGFLTVPWILLGELFPLSTRGIMSSAANCANCLLYFAAAKSFPASIRIMGTHGLFAFYASVAVMGTVVSYCFVPETDGRTLEDIQEDQHQRRPLSGGSKKRVNGESLVDFEHQDYEALNPAGRHCKISDTFTEAKLNKD